MTGLRPSILLLFALASEAQEVWMEPPAVIRDIILARPRPELRPDPTGRRLLVVEREGLPPLAWLARPMHRLAGLRFDAELRTLVGQRPAASLAVVEVATGERTPLVLPEGLRPFSATFSPDGNSLALQVIAGERVEAWMWEPSSVPRRLIDRAVLGLLAPAIRWMPDGESLLLVAVAGSADPVGSPGLPLGPGIQETSGPPGPARTYQDLLRNARDEELFEQLLMAELLLVPKSGGEPRVRLGPALWSRAEPSPDGRFILLEEVVRPFSRSLPWTSFPRILRVVDAAGAPVAEIARTPLLDRIPIEGVPTGPRSFQWAENEDAVLVFVEALDGGDPRRPAVHRDRIQRLEDPFTGPARAVFDLEHRYRGLAWLEAPGEALATEFDRDRRWLRTTHLRISGEAVAARTLFDRSARDRYNDPGRPVTGRDARGREVVRMAGGSILLSGAGATPDGDRPFLDRLHLETGATERLWQSAAGLLESVVDVPDPEGRSLVIARESPATPPAWVRLDRATGEEVVLLSTADPAPAFRRVQKELIHYRRADGVPLSGTLYLPPDVPAGERAPLLVWAYPEEFSDPGTAGQVSGSPLAFTVPRAASHLLLVLAGYAVLDGAAMPVIGTPETGNDAFIPQVVAAAEAAIRHLDGRGLIDPARVAVGGHSYGAFMTANLLAHCELFRCGIARSGAYNRTLTPFGFQSERRSLWEAPGTYHALSPFSHAHRIRAPLLLIHGEADSNPGTFPMQSERLYAALKGHGAVARLVMLPYENHAYSARESCLHVAAEMIAWLDRYLAKP
jgi:dipeptidyl aminopeptidase/acylaminoacyl peptidase